ncbi:YcfL family protein [Pseudomonas sp. NPDC099000]|uniref:YcfL family protein n=1 Tax=Pseudomonas sp. NPDC099000 TaxID=3364488 RepID=UPI00383B2F9A
MGLKCFAIVALALLAGCATPPPPPEPGSAASKVLATGPIENVAIGPMRMARENGFLTVNTQLSNTDTRNRTLYYRYLWLGAEGFAVADADTWKSLTLYAEQTSFLPAIAPVPQAVDFRLEINTP